MFRARHLWFLITLALAGVAVWLDSVPVMVAATAALTIGTAITLHAWRTTR